jgi:uncharacterized protein
MTEKASLKLSQSTIEKLGYYIYLLIDPRDNKVFYVGKGNGNRINQHLLGALDNKTKESEKIKRIREIENGGHKIMNVILRHGLTEKEAFEVESAMIDFLGKDKLTNIVSGHHSLDNGLMDLEELKIKYEAPKAVFDEPAILITINRAYYKGINSNELYEATRKHWNVNINRVANTKIACAVYRGIIREVYSINEWKTSPKKFKGRHYFIGQVASPAIREKYRNKSVREDGKKAGQNPIKYASQLK